MKALTPRQLAFAHAYAKHGVAERAAIEAGYSERTARGSAATRLLANAGIAEEIERLKSQATEKALVDVKRVVEELMLLGFADLADFVEWGPKGVTLRESATLDAAKRRAIVEVAETANGVKIKLADKNAALDKLGRYLGIFVDKIEHSGDITIANPRSFGGD